MGQLLLLLLLLLLLFVVECAMPVSGASIEPVDVVPIETGMVSDVKPEAADKVVAGFGVD